MVLTVLVMTYLSGSVGIIIVENLVNSARVLTVTN